MPPYEEPQSHKKIIWFVIVAVVLVIIMALIVWVSGKTVTPPVETPTTVVKQGDGNLSAAEIQRRMTLLAELSKASQHSTLTDKEKAAKLKALSQSSTPSSKMTASARLKVLQSLK